MEQSNTQDAGKSVEGRASYSINSTHYNGNPAHPVAYVKSLHRPEPSKSLLPDTPIGTFSYHFGENPIYAVKDGRVLFRTANTVHSTSLDEFRRYGNFFSNADDIGYAHSGMKKWLAAGEDVKPADFDIVPSFPELVRSADAGGTKVRDGITEGVPLRMYFPDKRDTPVELYVRKTEVFAPINKAGYLISLNENWEQAIRDFLFDYREIHSGEHNPEAVALMKHYKKDGYKKPSRLINIGRGIIRKEAAAATLYNPNEKGYVSLIGNEDFFDVVVDIAHSMGISGEEAYRLVKDYIIGHEEIHFFENGRPNWLRSERRVERNAGKTHEKFYSGRKKIADAEDSDVYNALEGRSKDYGKHFSIKSYILDQLSGEGSNSTIDDVVAELESDGELQGLSEADAKSYIASRLDALPSGDAENNMDEAGKDSVSESSSEEC